MRRIHTSHAYARRTLGRGSRLMHTGTAYIPVMAESSQGLEEVTSLPYLIVGVEYPGICEVYDGDLDCLLQELGQRISGYSCTLQASCKDKNTKTFTRYFANYVTGGSDSAHPYCKTYTGKSDGIPTVLIQLLSNDAEIKKKTFVHGTIKTLVEKHVTSKTNQKITTLPPLIIVCSTPTDKL